MEGSTNTKSSVAYFCMEFGLNQDLKIYAGGLGILAGDILKTAREHDYPIIGVGLLWKQGYTTQLIDENNQPYDSYPIHDSIYQYLQDTEIKISVTIQQRSIFARVWKLEGLNNNTLYLLDTHLPENNEHKDITNKLYNGSRDKRIPQEIILGIGGVQALRQLGEDIDIYHFNEGHAALAGTELIREKMEQGLTFNQAWKKTRDEIVFTTHTPVKEGNETHELDLLNQMGAFNGLTYEQMEAIGGDPFNMTVAGLRLSRKANAVSRLHKQTTDEMWKDVEDRAPILAITNGIHRQTWVDNDIMEHVSNPQKLWEIHQQHKQALLRYIKLKNAAQLLPDRLLIGFARRAAEYKRPDLIFRKPEIIGEYLEQHRLQLVFAGKAHPQDNLGKEIVANLVAMADRYPDTVVFIEDYDIEVAQLLTKGVDIWLNNPRKPLEASGTSGMKAAMNGVLNLSVLDGWWPEACEHGVNGWQFGDGYQGEDQDQHDLDALYDVLLNEVIPVYYEDHDQWIKMMQNSINDTYEQYSARRMLQDYYQKLYN